MKKLITLVLTFISIALFSQNPQLLKDVFPGNNTGTIQKIVKTTNYTFFNEDDDDADVDRSLFRTDGTNAGTIKLNLTYPGYISTKAEMLTALGNKVVFAGDNFTNYGEIWSSDGTQAGTVALERFQPNSNRIPVVEINAMGSYAYYSVIDKDAGGINHAYLRRTDGTAAGTSLVYDFSAFTGVPQVVFLTPVNNILYFIVYDAGGTGVDQLWRSDGTTAGTYMVYNFTTSAFVESFIMPAGNTFYIMIGSIVGGVRQNTIWKSDGTAAGTVPVKLIGTGNSNTYPPFAAIGSTLYFAGVDGNGKELWKTDGTAGGTIMAADINAGGGNSVPGFLTAFNNNLYFAAENPTYGGELWKYDGSVATLVKDINPGNAASVPQGFVASGNSLVFSAVNNTSGRELWITDGTSANTVMIADINPGAGSSSPNTFTPGNTVYFAANNGTSGFEVFKYDNNGDVLAGPHKFYVNDNSLAGDLLTYAIGNNSNNGSKAYPFATISYAITQVKAGDTIYVDAGTYAEQVTIDKGITIIGAGSSLTSIVNPASPLVPPPGPFAEYALIQTTQNIGDVNISNLQTTNIPANDGHSMLLQTGGSVKNCRIIDGGLGVFFRVESAAKNVVVENNFIQASVFAVACQGSGLTASVLNNTLNVTNPGFSVGIWVGIDFGPIAKLTATGNSINNYVYRGIVGNSYNTVLSENSILGTGQYAIENTASLAVATCNWYGTTDQTTIASKMTGAINFSPWLVNGTDNDPVTIGFQPVSGSCSGRQKFFVNDNNLTGDVFTTAVGNNANSGVSSAPLATIANALSRVQAGDTIIVDAGSYTELVNINKNITIRGAGKGVTIINGPASHIVPFPNTGESGIIQTLNGLTDVIIENLTVDGTASDEQHGIFIQGGGRVSNCELRYVNDGFYFQYISAQPRTAIGENNYIHHINYVGSLFAGNGLTATATNNVIDLSGAQYGIGFIAGYGGDGNVASFTASNNSIININGFGIMIGSLQTAQVHNNSITRISGNNSFIQNVHTVNIDATCNWYGTTDATAIIPYITGAVTYSPWLTNGTDNDVAFGFQPVANSCNGRQNKLYVNDNSLTGDVFTSAVGNDANSGIPSAPLLTIGAAVTKAQAGDSIFVDAGTYTMSDFTIDKAITIIGTNYQNSPNNPANKIQINPTRNTESTISGATINLAAANISLQGLVFDPGNKVAMSLNFNLVSPATPQNYGNISLKKNRFVINSASAQVIFIGVTSPGVLAAAATASSALISSGYDITDNRFEKLNTTSGFDFSIHGVKNVTIDNNSFVVTGPTPRTQVIAGMGNNSVIDNVTITNNTVDRANGFVTGNRYTNTVITGNKIYNTTTAFNISNTQLESSTIEFSNNLLDGSSGIAPFVFYTRGGGGGAGASSLFKAENNTVTGVAVPGTTTLLGTFNATFTNTVLSPTLIIRGNKITFSGDLSTVEGQFIRPIVIRGKLTNATVEKNELTLAGTNLQPKNPANVLSVCPAISLYSDNGSGSVIPAGAVINILNNKVQGFKYSFIIFDPTNAAGAGDAFTGFGNLGPNIAVNVHENSFTADSMSINNGSVGYPIDASCNWYGSAAVQNLVGKFSTDIDNIYVPYLSNGTDNDPATGFQPVPGSCNGQPLQARLDGFTNVTCNGVNNGTASVTVFNGVAPYVFAWTKDGDPLFSSNVEDPTNFGPGTYHLSITDALGTNIILDENTDITTIDVTITEPPLLTANAGGTNVSCFNGTNGTASVTAGGGTLPYTYLWSNGGTNASISNLSAGIYSVTVTDGNGCTKSASYEVTQPALLTGVATGTSTTCANSATVVANGGTAPYTYLWSNGATTQTISSLPAGTYNVTVTDAKGCQATASCTVTAAEAFNPSASVVNASCYNTATGSITVTNANATAPFRFSIDGVNFSAPQALPYTFSNLAAGTYTITVRDANGCTGFVTKTITQPAQLTATLNTVQSTCYGQSTGSISVTVSGGTTAYSYQWTGPNGYSSTQLNISNLAPGSYTLTVTDSKGCIKTLSASVPSYNEIIASAAITNVVCRSDANGAISVNVSGGSGNFSHKWNTGATTATISNLGYATYRDTITDLNSGCKVIKAYLVDQAGSQFKFSNNYPIVTPVRGCTPADLGSITVSATGGVRPCQFKLNNGSYQQDSVFTGLAAGAHTVYIKDAYGCEKSVQVTISDDGTDQYERINNQNNNNKQRAAGISIGTVVNARISSGDQDWFKFTTQAAGMVSYTISVTHPSVNYSIVLYKEGSNTIRQPQSSTPTSKTYLLGGPDSVFQVQVTGASSQICYSLLVQPTLLTRTATDLIVKENKMPIDKLNTSVFPNPHRGAFGIKIESAQDGTAIVELINSAGQFIAQKRIAVNKGGINIVNFSNMHDAILFYRVRIGNEISTGKVIGPN